MAGYSTNIERDTQQNENFRQVLFTDQRMQLVVMALKPGEEIGEEVHHVDQFIRVEAGKGQAIIDEEVHELSDGSAVIISAGMKHNIINTGEEPMKLYTIYAPPQHPDGTVHATKADADAAEAEEHK